MKFLALLLALMLLLCGCGTGADEASSAPQTATSSGYLDEDVDFTGKITIVGRWKCVTETKNGEVRDASADESYYIFQSDGTMESKIAGSELLDYSGYEYNEEKGTVTLLYAKNKITLNCTITLTTLTLSALDGSFVNEYTRVDYE